MIDVKEIKEQVKKVLIYSQSLEEVDIDNIIDTWLENKRDFIEAFNGNLIYEMPNKICFELDEHEKDKKITKFLNNVFNLWHLPELEKFIVFQKDGFFSNTVINEYVTSTGEVITKGTKLIKAFKYFTKDERLLNDIQSKASMIIQENKVEGKLCVSVHPLDYLSSSETTYNWRSCHSLDGEYRAGNLSYMMDKSTLVCYLKSDNNYCCLPDFPESVPWNSKKWRTLLFMSNDWNMMFAGRQYPFSSQTGIKYVLNTLLPQAGLLRGVWSDWSKEKITNYTREDGLYIGYPSPYIPLHGGLIAMSDLIIDAKHSRHYNDLLFSSCYDPEYTVKIDEWAWGRDIIPNIENTRFTIGHKTPCVVCGATPVIEDSMLCNDCYDRCAVDSYAYCDCCGSRLSDNDPYTMVEDEIICENCYDKCIITCERCDEDKFKEDVVYNSHTQQYLCKDCNSIVMQELGLEEEEE